METTSGEARDAALRLELQFAVSRESWGKVERVREAVDLCVALVYDESDGAIVLEVTSRLPENGGGGALAASIDAIAAFPSPMEAYMSALAKVAEMEPLTGSGEGEDASQAKSGLGLVRIAYEGGFALSTRVEGDRVTICARRPHAS